MTTDAQQLPYALDPLIAEAKRRRHRRRLLVSCVAAAVALVGAGLALDQRSPTGPAINQAALAALSGTWAHHGASLVIASSGWGLAKFRTYREKPPGNAEISMRVISASRTGNAISARFRVTHQSWAGMDAPAGTFGTVRLWRGVIYWSIAKWSPAGGRAVTFCSVKPGARWICGL